jgi:ribose transport system permease protein
MGGTELTAAQLLSRATRNPARRLLLNPPAVVGLCCMLLLLAGSAVNPNFLTTAYLLQQLQIAAFLGLAAAGLMVVILLGHIDLSVPWTITTGAMMAAAAGASWGAEWAIPAGLICGALVGLVNGLGVAFLRIPSMIFTLGANAVLQGLMVLYTGGHAPQDAATALMRDLAVGKTLGVPNAALVWVAVSVTVHLLLTRTAAGRYVCVIGNSERAAYLSGVRTAGMTVLCFVACGLLAALAGVLLAGYSGNAYQAMGDPYLLPAIAAVVLGGTSILGGRGTYPGTVAGVVFIVLLQSMLAVLQMPEAGRQIIYGSLILAMLLVYGRSAKWR